MLRYPKHALAIAILTIAVVGVRVHENLPFVQYLRPVVLAAYGGMFVLCLEAPYITFRRALDDQGVRLIFAYFGWAMVTAPFALYATLAVNLTVILVPIAIACIAIMMVPPDRWHLERCLIGLVAAVGLLGLATLATPNPGERLSASGSFDPNDLAAVMALGFPFALGLTGRGSRRTKALGLATAVICPMVVIATASRGGTIALVAGALVYCFGLRGRRRALLLVSLVVLGTVGWFRASDTFRERIVSLNSLDEDYNSTEYTGRRAIWRRGVGYVLEHPVAGVGFSNFPIAEGGYAARLGIAAKWSAAHNAYIQAFAELGLVGGALFVSVLWVSIRRAAQLWKQRGIGARVDYQRPEFLASLCAFCFSAYFLSHAYFGLVFCVAALVAQASRVVTWEARLAPLPIPPRSGAHPRRMTPRGRLVRV